MRVICCLLFGLCLWSGVAEGMDWQPCDSTKSNGMNMFVPDAVTLTPDPPTIGESVFFSIKGQADRAVASGSLDISVAFEGIDIYQDSKDLCGRTTCPIQKGPIDISYSQDLPPIAPPGDYAVQVVAKDSEGSELMCIVVNFELVPPGSAWFQKTKNMLGGRKSGQQLAVV